MIIRAIRGRILHLSADISNAVQTLDLWSGVIHSRFEIDGAAVEVTTVCHPLQDLVAVRLESEALASGRLGVEIAFARGHDLTIKNNPPLDWSRPESHQTWIASKTPSRVDIERRIDDTRYHVAIAWQGGGCIGRRAGTVAHFGSRQTGMPLMGCFHVLFQQTRSIRGFDPDFRTFPGWLGPVRGL